MNRKILIIDDEKEIQEAIRTTIASHRLPIDIEAGDLFNQDGDNASEETLFHVDVASQGEEGLNLVKKACSENSPYAVAFIDMRMPPGWDGAKTASEIRKVSSTTEIVFITAFADLGTREIQDQEGGIENLLFLKKPFEPAEIESMVAYLTHTYDLKQRLKQQIETKNREITNRKLAEELEREIRQKLQALIQASPIAIITIDISGNVYEWNQSAEQIFGWNPDEVIGKPLLIFPAEKQDWFHRILQDELEGKQFTDEATIGQKKSGEIIDISFSSAPIRNARNEISGMMAVIADITDRVRAEEKLQKAYQSGMAENAISVLHNIGNAITPAVVNIDKLSAKETGSIFISYFTNLYEVFSEHLQKRDLESFLLEDIKGKQMLPFFQQLIGQLSEQQNKEQTQLFNIKYQIQHITETISLQQKYANIHAKEEKFKLQSLIKDVLTMMQPVFEKRKVELTLNITEDLPPIHSDRNKLVQVLINLLKNAVESIDDQLAIDPSMSPRISIDISLTGADYFSFDIEDNGTGVSKEMIDHVFEFGTTTKKSGSGFGLHDCANFIRASQGRIQLSSEGVGKGAVISFTLPVK